MNTIKIRSLSVTTHYEPGIKEGSDFYHVRNHHKYLLITLVSSPSYSVSSRFIQFYESFKLKEESIEENFRHFKESLLEIFSLQEREKLSIFLCWIDSHTGEFFSARLGSLFSDRDDQPFGTGISIMLQENGRLNGGRWLILSPGFLQNFKLGHGHDFNFKDQEFGMIDSLNKGEFLEFFFQLIDSNKSDGFFDYDVTGILIEVGG